MKSTMLPLTGQGSKLGNCYILLAPVVYGLWECEQLGKLLGNMDP